MVFFVGKGVRLKCQSYKEKSLNHEIKVTVRYGWLVSTKSHLGVSVGQVSSALQLLINGPKCYS